MQALKPVKDSAANGDVQDGPRGRRYGSNVHRIKNMFQQMQTPAAGDAEGGEDAGVKSTEKSVRLSLPRAGSLNENVDHSALLKLGSTVSERVSKFDPKSENGHQRASSPSYSKLQETRRIFEQQQQQEKLATTRVLLKAEKVPGFQDGRLDMVSRFNGSTESLDSLDTSEAVSPTVSQLSAVFERAAELRNNLHRLSSTPPLPSRGISTKVGVLNSKIITKRVSAFVSSNQEEETSNQKGQEMPPRGHRGRGTPPSESVNGGQGVDPTAGLSCHEEEPNDHRRKTVSDAGVEAKTGANPEEQSGAKDPNSTTETLEDREPAAETRSSPKTEETLRQEGDAAEEEEEEDRTLDTSVDISAYSAAGDDYGDPQKLEEDYEEQYEPESSCVEIPGLTVEEDPPPARKIRFSTEPIKVRGTGTTHPGVVL